MSNIDIIRAWKDEEYRLSLTPEQLAALPVNPAGQMELVEAELEEVAGGLQKPPSAGNGQTRPGGGGGTGTGGGGGTSRGTGGNCTKCSCCMKG
jgi:mersacidin/lichenicidin family type 2 lantibiotic